MNQKGFVNILLIVLVVILAGAAGYFALRKPSTTPVTEQPITTQVTPPVNNTRQTPSPTNNVSPQTNSWKTYRNKQYEFEFGYPSQIQISVGVKSIQLTEETRNTNRHLEGVLTVRLGNPLDLFWVLVEQKPNNFSGLHTYLNELFASSRSSSITETNVGGVKGFLVHSDTHDPRASTSDSYYFESENYLIVLNVDHAPITQEALDMFKSINPNDVQVEENAVKQILQTFKLTSHS